MATDVERQHVEAVRAFNRDYTRVAGLLTENLLDTPHSLSEARVIFELDAVAELPMGDLRAGIGLDAGYLSRLVSRLERNGLLRKRRSERDGRVQLLSLTAAGADRRATLDARSAEQVATLLEPITDERRDELVGAMRVVARALGTEPPAKVAVRPLQGGDLGWILQRHGVLFPREYGWGPGFEALIAQVVAEFVTARDESGNGGWIAELGGERVGSILCVRVDGSTAKLRLLLVEPSARGRGVGTLLVEECIAFARAAGYEELVLWTMDVLTHARQIYERAGFELIDSEPHTMFGPRLIGQTWRLEL